MYNIQELKTQYGELTRRPVKILSRLQNRKVGARMDIGAREAQVVEQGINQWLVFHGIHFDFHPGDHEGHVATVTNEYRRIFWLDEISETPKKV